MKEVICVFDEMEITTVDQIKPGDIFFYPVSSRFLDSSRYRVLQNTGPPGEGLVRLVIPGNKTHEKFIVCLNVVSESVVNCFLPDAKCMIGFE